MPHIGGPFGVSWCAGQFNLVRCYDQVRIIPQAHINWFPYPLQTHKMFESSHMSWMGQMGRPPSQVTGKDTPDVVVHWLRPQTPMEWFQCPLQTYTRCLRAVICHGWGQMGQPPTSQVTAGKDIPAVHWLRPQAHMEWFPHPLQVYTRCLRAVICHAHIK